MINNAKTYDQWHEAVHAREDRLALNLKDWHQNALGFLPPLQGLNILEVGCGSGDFAIYLASQGANVTAVDFSSKAIEIAQEKAKFQGKLVKFQVADAQSLPFESNSFDLVVSCECLEHVPVPQLALNEMSRILKHSGKLVLTTENYSNAMLLYWLACWLRKEPFNSGEQVQPIEHFFLFWRVGRMLHQAGLRVTHLLGSHHVFLLLPRFHPHTFVIEQFQNSLITKLMRPLARHMAFEATKE